MIYLSHFFFPSREREYGYLMSELRTCYDSFYPFRVLSEHDFDTLEPDQVTILCGGNGSGKSTALNVIAETLQLERDTLYNRSNFFDDYTQMCAVSYTHLRAHETGRNLVCRLLLEKKKRKRKNPLLFFVQ